MAAAPQFKVYRKAEGYVAATKFIDDAAAIIALRGQDGDTIRDGHKATDAVWTHGLCGDTGESYDAVIEHAARYGRHQDHAGEEGALAAPPASQAEADARWLGAVAFDQDPETVELRHAIIKRMWSIFAEGGAFVAAVAEERWDEALAAADATNRARFTEIMEWRRRVSVERDLRHDGRHDDECAICGQAAAR